jgi:hypothetical protein
MGRNNVKGKAKENLPFPEPVPLLNARLTDKTRKKGRLT